MADREKKKKFRIERRAIITGIITFIVAVCVFVPVRGAAAKTHTQTVFHTDKDNTVLAQDMEKVEIDYTSDFFEAFQGSDRVNILLIGINDGMTDTIMVASYNFIDQNVNIISIPRDTHYYRGPGYASYASHKINAIYNSQGMAKLAGAVSEILYGMPIHYYAMVNYKGVQNIMDVIGGVQMEIPFHMKYVDSTPGLELYIDIPAGKQTIDSSNVMQFLRFRHTNPSLAAQGYKSYPGGDIQRIQMQQEFVVKVIKECLKAGNIMDVMQVALDNVESDLTYAMAAKIAFTAMKGLSGENVHAYTLPGYDTILHELSFWQPDETGINDLLQTIYNMKEEAPETTPAAVTP